MSYDAEQSRLCVKLKHPYGAVQLPRIDHGLLP
jgi:hypothetical protein